MSLGFVSPIINAASQPVCLRQFLSDESERDLVPCSVNVLHRPVSARLWLNLETSDDYIVKVELEFVLSRKGSQCDRFANFVGIESTSTDL